MAPRNAPDMDGWASDVYNALQGMHQNKPMTVQQQLQFVLDYNK